MDARNSWVLIDGYGDPFADHVYPRTPVENEANLRRLLLRYSEQEPRLLWLEDDGVPRIGPWLGGAWGAVEAFRCPPDGRSYIAVNTGRQPSEEVLFVGDWQPSALGPPYLFPSSEAIDLIVELYRDRHLPPRVRWDVSG